MRFAFPDSRDREWHRWFAWYPVWVKSMQRHVWLEPLDYRYEGGIWPWEYRARGSV